MRPRPKSWRRDWRPWWKADSTACGQGLRLPAVEPDRLGRIGAAVVALLADKDLSHMARYVLERVPGPEPATALREALPKLVGP